MAISDKRKQSFYIPNEMLEEIKAESLRQDRTMSWLMQRAWRVARAEIVKMPAVNDEAAEPSADDPRGKDE